jgi:hypothetical protein
MFGSLTIKVVGGDDDYLGLDIRASNERFGGSARVYAGLNDLTDLAELISGFPKNATDERKYEFGSQEPNVAGGFCSMRFSCSDGAGHARLDVLLNDDDGWYEHGSASFGFQVFAVDIDRFVLMLKGLEARRIPEAKLETIQ